MASTALTIDSTDYTYSNYTEIVNQNNTVELIPPNILNDINLLYSYKLLDSLSEQDFAVYGVPVIDNMIYNVCHTVIGTREFEPEFGSKCLIMIQELCTQTNAEILAIELFASIKRWVPFCSLIYKSTYCYPDPDNNLMVAYIEYIDLFQGLKRNFVMDFIK